MLKNVCVIFKRVGFPIGILPNGALPNGGRPNGARPNGARLNGARPNSTFPNRASPISACQDSIHQKSPRIISTTKVHLVETKKPKSKKEYFKTMHKNQKLASSTKPPGWDEAKPYEEMPGPKPLPIIGNSWRFIISELKGEDLGDLLKL